MRDRVLVFARYPEAGRVKTRLIPALGAERAARLHRRMTEVAVETAMAAGAACTVSTTGAAKRRFRAWLGDAVHVIRQPQGDLGARMLHGFRTASKGRADRVVAIGADVPDISTSTLQQAFAALENADVVLGPATDGGYTLIGMKKPHAVLFRGPAWGTASVLEHTLSLAREAGLVVKTLTPLGDIDRAQDLERLRDDARFRDLLGNGPSLSVIIPTLNEEASIGETVRLAAKETAVDVLVVDGGSRDQTCTVAAKAGARVLQIGGGRAAQLNAGAKAAHAARFLFLHADTQLPEAYASAVHSILDDPATVAGAFRFSTDGEGWGMQLVEWGTNLRSIVFRFPYGDQGLFMERRVFDAVGGFAPLPIMEDYELVRRLRRRGRVAIAADYVRTSARRWEHIGIVNTLVRNQLMILGFRVGLAPERLARFYRGSPRVISAV